MYLWEKQRNELSFLLRLCVLSEWLLLTFLCIPFTGIPVTDDKGNYIFVDVNSTQTGNLESANDEAAVTDTDAAETGTESGEDRSRIADS